MEVAIAAAGVYLYRRYKAKRFQIGGEGPTATRMVYVRADDGVQQPCFPMLEYMQCFDGPVPLPTQVRQPRECDGTTDAATSASKSPWFAFMSRKPAKPNAAIRSSHVIGWQPHDPLAVGWKAEPMGWSLLRMGKFSLEWDAVLGALVIKSEGQTRFILNHLTESVLADEAVGPTPEANPASSSQVQTVREGDLLGSFDGTAQQPPQVASSSDPPPPRASGDMSPLTDASNGSNVHVEAAGGEDSQSLLGSLSTPAAVDSTATPLLIDFTGADTTTVGPSVPSVDTHASPSMPPSGSTDVLFPGLSAPQPAASASPSLASPSTDTSNLLLFDPVVSSDQRTGPPHATTTTTTTTTATTPNTAPSLLSFTDDTSPLISESPLIPGLAPASLEPNTGTLPITVDAMEDDDTSDTNDTMLVPAAKNWDVESLSQVGGGPEVPFTVTRMVTDPGMLLRRLGVNDPLPPNTDEERSRMAALRKFRREATQRAWEQLLTPAPGTAAATSTAPFRQFHWLLWEWPSRRYRALRSHKVPQPPTGDVLGNAVLWQSVLSFCDDQTYGAFAQTCRFWHYCVATSPYWRIMGERLYGPAWVTRVVSCLPDVEQGKVSVSDALRGIIPQWWKRKYLQSRYYRFRVYFDVELPLPEALSSQSMTQLDLVLDYRDGYAVHRVVRFPWPLNEDGTAASAPKPLLDTLMGLEARHTESLAPAERARVKVRSWFSNVVKRSPWSSLNRQATSSSDDDDSEGSLVDPPPE